jgi:hypothetical protein
MAQTKGRAATIAEAADRGWLEGEEGRDWNMLCVPSQRGEEGE